MRVGRSISIPKDHWEAFKEEAERNDQSLSEWVGEACIAALPKGIQKKLLPRPGRGRPEKKKDK